VAITGNTLLMGGILQAINLDLLHPIGLEIRVSTDDTLSLYDHSDDEKPTAVVYVADSLNHPDFTNARIAFLRFHKEQILKRVLVVPEIYQVVPGNYCRDCGCTELQPCIEDGTPCTWVISPGEGGPRHPGICSACAVVEIET
jgi:hypothetical protein